MMDGKTLPFKLERGRRGCLAEQIAALLREAIVTGYYKPGDVLPPIRELAHMLEVGRVNVERAIAKLTDEGLINPRPKIGSVVCGTDTPLWKGQAAQLQNQSEVWPYQSPKSFFSRRAAAFSSFLE